jgi:hypothetical protein
VLVKTHNMDLQIEFGGEGYEATTKGENLVNMLDI